MRAFLVIIIGLALLTGGFFVLYGSYNTILNGEKIQATIIDKYIYKHPDGDRTYLKLEFVNKTEKLIEDVLTARSFESIIVGESVMIYYLQGASMDVVIDKERSVPIGN